eukprot:TRINITY_DN5878_c0_g1_i1.p1 TRINITY_DN5878_c0_g1~~TRINITY_DN5878_c0_g1_i1.p1  ORF type:complete len:449 (+),score=64.42 TRINITY_DN5878_c0_g1_i1:108-1454(+)
MPVRSLQSVAIATITLLLLGTVPATAQEYDFGIMLDAGSSGTRVYIFTWLTSVRMQAFPDINSAPIGQVQWSLKTSPGLSSVNATGVPNHLSPLIAYAKSKVPQAKYNSTPIYLKATAGMRLVPLPVRLSTMSAVRDYLSQQGFVFEPEYAQVISGEEEGVTGWVTVNSLSKSMDLPKPYGAIDLGGASMQITFQTDEPPLSSYFDLRINKRRFQLYTHSYLNYGADRARDRYNTAIQNQTGSVTWNPCMFQGYSAMITANGTSLGNFSGTSDFTTCRSQVRGALFPVSYCPAEPCAIASTYQPAVQGGTFYAFSNMYYTASFFNCSGLQPVSCLATNAQTYCSGNTWAAATAQNPSVSAGFLATYCFGAAYILEVLSAFGFGLTDQLNFALSISGVEVGWALGAMTYEVGAWEPQCATCNPTVNVVMANMFQGMAGCTPVMAPGSGP